MKKMLITGSNGFIGKNLIEFYKNKFIILQHSRENKIEDLLKENPDIIINCAASIYDENVMFESNVLLVKKILDHTKQTNCKLIHLGSSSEYGRKTRPTKESDCLSPTTLYETTKSAATMLCIGYAKTYNLDIVVARPYSVYGKYEKSYRLFPRLYNAFVNNQAMTLYNGVHDFIYIKDFIKGIDILLNSNKDKICGDIVNFGSGKQYTNFEILNFFKNQFKSIPQIEINTNMNKSFESDIWICDTEYAYKKYNFSCDYDIESGIFDYIQSMK